MSTKPIQRYDVTTINELGLSGGFETRTVARPHPYGEWVKASDYQTAMAQQAQALAGAREALRLWEEALVAACIEPNCHPELVHEFSVASSATSEALAGIESLQIKPQ